MALNLYAIGEDEGYHLIDNNTTKITTFHDTSDGSYKITKFYISNSPTTYGYENITISLVVNGEENGPVSANGIVYQLLGIDSLSDLPDPASWEHIPFNNTIAISNVPVNQETTRYFALRTYVPRGHGANYITEASLKINATEIVD